MNKQLTISQAAKILGMTRQGVLDHVQRGNLPSTRLGYLHVITCEDLEAFEQARMAKRA